MTPVFSHRLEVRFRDCDPLGHANNAVYLTYLEQARFAHWRAMGLAMETRQGQAASYEAAGIPGVILARVEIDYRRPATHGETLDIVLGIAAMGTTSFTYEYEVRDLEAKAVAHARTVIVRYDYAAGRPVPIPDELKRALLQPVGA